VNPNVASHVRPYVDQPTDIEFNHQHDIGQVDNVEDSAVFFHGRLSNCTVLSFLKIMGHIPHVTWPDGKHWATEQDGPNRLGQMGTRLGQMIWVTPDKTGWSRWNRSGHMIRVRPDHIGQARSHGSVQIYQVGVIRVGQDDAGQARWNMSGQMIWVGPDQTGQARRYGLGQMIQVGPDQIGRARRYRSG